METIKPISVKKLSNNEKSNEIYLAQTGRINSLLSELYYRKSGEEFENANYRRSIQYLEKIPDLVPNKMPILMNLARCYYQLGDLPNAEKITKQMRAIDKKHPAAAINNAFFGILQKNYDRTVFWYDQILKATTLNDIDVLEVIAFLNEEYLKDPSEHAFLYGMGVLNHHADPKSAKKDLSKFIRFTKKKDDYKVLTNRAKELLTKLKK